MKRSLVFQLQLHPKVNLSNSVLMLMVLSQIHQGCPSSSQQKRLPRSLEESCVPLTKSCVGGLQPSGSERWAFLESMFQTTVKKETGIKPVSPPLRYVFIVVIIDVVVFYLCCLLPNSKCAKYMEVAAEP